MVPYDVLVFTRWQLSYKWGNSVAKKRSATRCQELGLPRNIKEMPIGICSRISTVDFYGISNEAVSAFFGGRQ